MTKTHDWQKVGDRVLPNGLTTPIYECRHCKKQEFGDRQPGDHKVPCSG